MNRLPHHVLALLPTLGLAAAAAAQCTTLSATAYAEVVAPGCGTPVLVVSAPPQFGTVTTLDAVNLDLGTFGIQIVVYAFKLPPTSPPAVWTGDVLGYPLASGCFNHLPDASLHVLAIGYTGVTSVAIAVPASGYAVGSIVSAQAFQLDLNTVSFSSATNSVCLYLGP